jgi:hypothetical protein
VWQRQHQLLLGGRLISPTDASVTPSELKAWFKVFARGENLGNTQNKEPLANKALNWLAGQLGSLHARISNLQQHIAVLRSQTALGPLRQPGPPVSAAPTAATWQQIAAATGIPYLSECAFAALGTALQPVPFAFPFMGMQPPSK